MTARVVNRAWLTLAVLTVHLFERSERIAYCTPCDAWYRAGRHSHS